MPKRNKTLAAMPNSMNHNHGDKVKPAQSRLAVRVECPSEGDVIARPCYTFHIAAAGADAVDVSIDQGEWLACREALGLWWYDWSGFDAGVHEVVARRRMGEGLLTNSATRRFLVN